MPMLTLALIALAGLPALAHAQSFVLSACSGAFSGFSCLAQNIINILGFATAALVGVAIVIYFWGIVRGMYGYAKAGSAPSYEKLRSNLVWGFVAIFLILSIWGIISLLGNTLFGTNNFNSLWG